MEYSEYIAKKFKELIDNEVNLIREIKKDFFLLVQPVFEKYPTVKKISFIGYTPGWNDGDPCEYYICYSEMGINGIGSYEDDEDSEWEPEFNDAFNEFQEKFKTIPNSYYENIFGNNKKTIIYSDGLIESEYYRAD